MTGVVIRSPGNPRRKWRLKIKAPLGRVQNWCFASEIANAPVTLVTHAVI
jgi:hypothetical protein